MVVGQDIRGEGSCNRTAKPRRTWLDESMIDTLPTTLPTSLLKAIIASEPATHCLTVNIGKEDFTQTRTTTIVVTMAVVLTVSQ